MPVNWVEIESESGNVRRSHLFAAMQEIARQIQLRERDDPEVLQSVPRLAELIQQHTELADFKPVLDSLARSVGLWNYIDRATADSPESVVAEAAVVPELGNIALHREQQVALASLLAGRNLILSAPTSFGKSLLIDALLVSGSYIRVAIVLPTIALMDEFRRRLTARFGTEYDVLMHHSERQSRNKVIFLGTQERLINRDDLGALDLAIVDEFYKLDPARGDQRSVVLNAAVYKLLGRAKQFFFLGPNIDGVTVGGESRWKFEFLKTRFSTVAVDTFDLTGEKEKPARLAAEAYNEKNWPVLVFVSSPDRANVLAKELADNHGTIGGAATLAEWIDENYGAGWPLSEAVRSGIGVHHGRVPRALASRFVTLFNDGSLPILLCTSTLIEGVNTAAKSVLIFDKTINREDYDFFTFSNIKGRAGRLGQHHIGRVFLFHGAPDRTEVDVAPPLFGDLDDAPDEMVVHIDQEYLTSEQKDRIHDVSSRLRLSEDVVRRYSGLGIDVLEKLREAKSSSKSVSARALEWRGWPRWAMLLATCTLVCEAVTARRFGVASPKQLALYLTKLSNFSLMRDFYHWHSSSYLGNDASKDNVFKFLRACEFNLPELFMALHEICKTDGLESDYSAYAAGMQCWFRAEPLKVLEEQGIPIQISERFLRRDDTVDELRFRLINAVISDSEVLTAMERRWVRDALPDASRSVPLVDRI